MKTPPPSATVKSRTSYKSLTRKNFPKVAHRVKNGRTIEEISSEFNFSIPNTAEIVKAIQAQKSPTYEGTRQLKRPHHARTSETPNNVLFDMLNLQIVVDWLRKEGFEVTIHVS